MDWIADIISGLWQGFLGVLGISDAQKLGRAEVTNQQLKEDLHAKEQEARVMEAPARPESAVDSELLKHAGK
jgi:hypothetical protein